MVMGISPAHIFLAAPEGYIPIAITSHFSTYRHLFVLLCPAILGFSFRAMHERASFA
jgi:hypothetical protein